jgi:putative oxidoreductase
MLHGFPILNVFPDLLIFDRLAPLILRVVLGLILADVGYLKFKSEKARWKIFFEGFGLNGKDIFVKIFGCIEILGGVALIFGFYTQISALVIALITFIEAYAEYKDSSLVKRNLVFYILLLAISISLLFTGAGAFSLDLPL